MNLHSIIFLICWHGDYPWYFPYFLHSCRYNTDIEFLIFTDNKNENINFPENAKRHLNVLSAKRAVVLMILAKNIAIED